MRIQEVLNAAKQGKFVGNLVVINPKKSSAKTESFDTTWWAKNYERYAQSGDEIVPCGNKFTNISMLERTLVYAKSLGGLMQANVDNTIVEIEA